LPAPFILVKPNTIGGQNIAAGAKFKAEKPARLASESLERWCYLVNGSKNTSLPVAA
jgi:hypothetical protein